MTDLVDRVQVVIDEMGDTDVEADFEYRNATGYITVLTETASVRLDFEADFDTEYMPAEYDEGYMVWGDELEVTGVDVTKLEVDCAIDLESEDEIEYTLSEDEITQVEKLISELISKAEPS